MDRQDSILRAVKANLRVAVGMAAFSCIVMVLMAQATWDLIAMIWLGWLSLAVMIGLLRGWSGEM
ncbi:MAG TPA: hypothetical protein VD886_17945 [Herpetosiphonaceae bacterium]|nr:hypothetical protein [Herpetosiphonaceae bacterium]